MKHMLIAVIPDMHHHFDFEIDKNSGIYQSRSTDVIEEQYYTYKDILHIY